MVERIPVTRKQPEPPRRPESGRPHPTSRPPTTSRPDPDEDVRAAARSTADYANFRPTVKKRRKIKGPSFNWRKLLKILIILAILAALAAGAYYLFLKDKPKPATTGEREQTTTPAPPPVKVESNVISTKTQHYASDQFNLEFDYPSDWQVTDNAGSGKLTVTSPELSLTDKDGKKVQGQIVMTIRNKQQPLPEFDKGNAMAARASEKVSYTKPSEGQRGQTYLSFLLFASSTGTTSGDFDGVFITGDNGYQKDQAIPKADITVDPVISLGYLKDGKPLTVADNMWDDPDYQKPIKAMLQSLTIK